MKSPDTQNSAPITEPPAVSYEERLAHLFREARQHYDRAVADDALGLALCKSALLRSKRCGEYLNRAQAAVYEKGDDWFPVLHQHFGEEKIRTCQVFMQIAAHWQKIEPGYAKNPDLTLDGALRILQGKPQRKPETDNMRKHRQVFNEAKEMLQHCWPIWSDEEIEKLHGDFIYSGDCHLRDAFQSAMVKLMRKFRQQVRAALPKPRPYSTLRQHLWKHFN